MRDACVWHVTMNSINTGRHRLYALPPLPPTNFLARSAAFLANVYGKQYCGRGCAISNGNVHAQVAGAVCGYAGCPESSLRHMQTGADLGYCSEAHRLVSTQGVLVSAKNVI